MISVYTYSWYRIDLNPQTGAVYVAAAAENTAFMVSLTVFVTSASAILTVCVCESKTVINFVCLLSY